MNTLETNKLSRVFLFFKLLVLKYKFNGEILTSNYVYKIHLSINTIKILYTESTRYASVLDNL
jgi:hypothetical protein